MGTKLKPGAFDCYAVALPDEPMFVLLGRDPSAPKMLRAWADQRRKDVLACDPIDTEDLHKATEADACADDMLLWRRENEGAWRDGKERRVAKLEPSAPEELALISAAVIDAVGKAVGIPSSIRGGVLSIDYHDERQWASHHFHGRRHNIGLLGEGQFEAIHELEDAEAFF